MKARLSEAQIIQLLRESERDGQTISELCRKHGISEQTFYRWRRKYGGMGEADVRRLKDLERENGRLKKLVAERDLEIDVLKEVLGKGS